MKTPPKTTIDSPAALREAVTELVAALHARGLGQAAQPLAEVQRTAFTTSSEWLGELGAAVRRIAAEPALPADVQARLLRVQAAVDGAGARRRAMRTAIAAGASYFGVVFAAGFALGTVRVPFLVPHLGERTAELIEMPLMALVIWLAARFVVRRHRHRLSHPTWLAVGAAALALMVGAELLLAAALRPGGIAAYVAGRDPVSGSVYLAMLAAFAALPWLLARPPAGAR